MAMRGHGKLSFATLTDVTGSIQLIMQESVLSDRAKDVLGHLDLGDWVGAEGEVITSRRGELSVDVVELTLLSKALRPPPDKWHGLSSTDTRYRQREVDLMANPESRRTFDIRFKTISALRKVLEDERFVEVETPILQPQAGGALARPFFTRSNALDIGLSLRIAPELYLKRLVIGGYERVFEIARNFRNEGIDTRHSPEFTALEAYRAFGDVHDGMDLTERLILAATEAATGRMTFDVGGGTSTSLRPGPAASCSSGWRRWSAPTCTPTILSRRCEPSAAATRSSSCPSGDPGSSSSSSTTASSCPPSSTLSLSWDSRSRSHPSPAIRPQTRPWPTGSSSASTVESSPTATASSTSPRSRRNGSCSEAEAVAKGDLEAHPADVAFIRALEYGLPPTSGIGIGVDRLAMLLAEVEAIRDVILFPMMRPEASA